MSAHELICYIRFLENRIRELDAKRTKYELFEETVEAMGFNLD